MCLEAGDLEAAWWRNRRYRHRLLLRSKVFSRIDEPILLEIVLLVVELAIPSIGLEQRFVRAALDDLAALEHEDLIGAANRRKPVRDHERRPATPERAQPVLNLRFALRVQARGRLIQHQDPRIGEDGARDRNALPLADYRTQLGVVLQDNFLFDGTIGENIAFARPHATRAEIEAVARIAHCDEFVEQFDEKYDTVVGERGVKLSGGQRQRISIARAILADPRILVLDEATSSLDSESEAKIQDGLRALRRGRTTFVIAHRLSTIRSADQILVLEGGQIVERGTHEELLVANGRYKQLYDKQYNFERDRFINPGEDFTPEPETGVSMPPLAPPGRL